MTNIDSSKLSILSKAFLFELKKCWEKICSSNKMSLGNLGYTGIDYSNQPALFEVGCYLYFMIDFWHYANKREYREAVVGYLVNQFSLSFKDTLNVENIDQIIQNRLEIYGRLIKENKDDMKYGEKIDFYLTEFISKTGNNSMPKIYNFSRQETPLKLNDFPLTLDALELFNLKLNVSTFLDIAPSFIKSLEKFYAMQ